MGVVGGASSTESFAALVNCGNAGGIHPDLVWRLALFGCSGGFLPRSLVLSEVFENARLMKWAIALLIGVELSRRMETG